MAIVIAVRWQQIFLSPILFLLLYICEPDLVYRALIIHVPELFTIIMPQNLAFKQEMEKLK